MYNTILLPIDAGKTSQRAIKHATELSAKHNGTVHIINCVLDDIAADNYEEVSDTRSKLFEGILSEFPDEIPIETHIEIGSPHESIVQAAEDLDADIILMGTHSRKGFQRLIFGSVTESTIRNTSRPVMAIPDKNSEEV